MEGDETTECPDVMRVFVISLNRTKPSNCDIPYNAKFHPHMPLVPRRARP